MKPLPATAPAHACECAGATRRPRAGIVRGMSIGATEGSEKRSRLGRIVARCGAVAVKTSLRPQFSENLTHRNIAIGWGGLWRGAVAVKTSLRTQSHHHHGLSLTTITDTVLRERNTPKHRIRLVSFVARCGAVTNTRN